MRSRRNVPWRKILRRIESLDHGNPPFWRTVGAGTLSAIFAAIVIGGVALGINFIKPFIYFGPPKGKPSLISPEVVEPSRERGVGLDIRLTNMLRLFGRNPAYAQVCIQVVNNSDKEAPNARIVFQHYDGDNWLGILTSWITCDWNQTSRLISYPPNSRFSALLTSESREGIEAFLTREGNKLAFAARVEWERPGQSPGCNLRYVEIIRIPSGEDPTKKVYFMKILEDPPEGVRPSPIGPCPNKPRFP